VHGTVPVWSFRDSSYFPTNFAASEPGTTPPKCRKCAHPPAERRRRCPDHLERDRARKLKKKALLHPKQNHPKLHLLPTDQPKLQPGVSALEGADIVVDKPEKK